MCNVEEVAVALAQTVLGSPTSQDTGEVRNSTRSVVRAPHVVSRWVRPGSRSA